MEKVLQTAGMLMFIIGAASMDSESLIFPGAMVLLGLLLLLFSVWTWNYRI